MPYDVVETLSRLVRTPSVNPMGRDVHGPEYYEYAVTALLEEYFEQLDVPWYRQPVAPGRDNIIARLDGAVAPEHGGAVLVFEAHQDTVPVDGMTIDPWEPAIRDGRLYGRGACDVKGGLACMLTAFARLAQHRPAPGPTVLIACTVNEEHGFSGARALADAWARHDLPLLPRRPDAVIVAEPTSLDVVVAHKGCVRWRCIAQGRAAHSAFPGRGENAVYQMAHALVALQNYAHQLEQSETRSPLGTPTLSVGTIQGGICVNAVPDRCVIEIDRRLMPDEHPDAARDAAMQWIAQHVPHADRLRHEPPFLAGPGLPDQTPTRLAQRLRDALAGFGRSPSWLAVPYCTDAPFFAALGIPTVVFGPGSIEQAHTEAEWVPLDQLAVATDVLHALASEPL
jgi:acetylornithine deacetylase